MNRSVFSGLIFILLVLPFFSLASAETPALPVIEYRDDKIDTALDVALRTDVTSQALVTFTGDADVFQARYAGSVRRMYSFGVALMTVDQATLLTLEQDSTVRFVEYAHRPLGILMDDVNRIVRVPESHALSIGGSPLTGAGQSVCVIDSGVDFTHPALAHANVMGCSVDCSGEDSSCRRDCSMGDWMGHGTHVAGIIAARGDVMGVAPDAGIISVRVFEEGSLGTWMSNVMNGIVWCTENAEEYNISVISMSLGGYGYTSREACDAAWPTIGATIRAANNQGIAVVAANGNEFMPYAILAPACISGVVPVGATSDDDAIAYFSNYASFVNIFAPGVDVISTIPTTPNYFVDSGWCSGIYCSLSGTSMATPVVSGAFALVQQASSLSGTTSSPSQIEFLLGFHGVPIMDVEFGYVFSRVDFLSTLLALDTIAPSVSLVEVPVAYAPSGSDPVSIPALHAQFHCSVSDWSLSSMSMRAFENGALVAEESRFLNFSSSGVMTFDVPLTDATSRLDVTCEGVDAQGNSYAASSVGDYAAPVISLISPASDSSLSSGSVSFSVSVSDSSSSACELTLDDAVVHTWDALDSTVHTYETTVGSGSHSWSVSCTDAQDLTSQSDVLSFTVAISESSSGSSGGGGGGGGSRNVPTSIVPLATGQPSSLGDASVTSSDSSEASAESNSLITGLVIGDVGARLRSSPLLVGVFILVVVGSFFGVRYLKAR